MRRSRLAALAALLLAAAVPAGAFVFLDLVLSRGDVYPAWSSFRSDPLGTRALFEALARQPGLAVSRLHGPLPAGGDAAGTVVLVLGLPAAGWEGAATADAAEAEAFLRAGGRLVLAFAPVAAEPAPEPGPPPRRQRSSRKERVARWGVTFRLDEASAPVVPARRQTGDATLPEVLSWRSALRLEPSAGGWSVLYAAGGRAVVASRPFGRGTLLLVGDASLTTNEAVRRERAAAFLAALVGDRRTVLFDETHLGVASQDGVMTLVRRHRLTGVVLVVLALFGLYVWRSATSLLPRRDDPAAAQRVSGRDSFAGLVRLLERGIPVSRLLPAVLAEWGRAGGRPTDEMARVAAGARRAADLPAAYAALCREAHAAGGPHPVPSPAKGAP